jgi:hypothetical protein
MLSTNVLLSGKNAALLYGDEQILVAVRRAQHIGGRHVFDTGGLAALRQHTFTGFRHAHCSV